MMRLSKSSAAALLTLALGVVPVIPAIAASPAEKMEVQVATRLSATVDGQVIKKGEVYLDDVTITFVEDENGMKKPRVPLPNNVEVEKMGTAEYSVTVRE